jgi:hypothetical protein
MTTRAPRQDGFPDVLPASRVSRFSIIPTQTKGDRAETSKAEGSVECVGFGTGVSRRFITSGVEEALGASASIASLEEGSEVGTVEARGGLAPASSHLWEEAWLLFQNQRTIPWPSGMGAVESATVLSSPGSSSSLPTRHTGDRRSEDACTEKTIGDQKTTLESESSLPILAGDLLCWPPARETRATCRALPVGPRTGLHRRIGQGVISAMLARIGTRVDFRTTTESAAPIQWDVVLVWVGAVAFCFGFWLTLGYAVEGLVR